MPIFSTASGSNLPPEFEEQYIRAGWEKRVEGPITRFTQSLEPELLKKTKKLYDRELALQGPGLLERIRILLTRKTSPTNGEGSEADRGKAARP